ncbi:YodL domain-containing protein [Bacillus seohaeanensis]|jgi:hypothetical protein|uniref:YodL domain-containing protein n=1 Tax=Bacillus seohaeanensis TaxID=284580 RepID=A0ABW5RPE3_9BACI
MALLERIIRPRSYNKVYDVTLFQTPRFRVYKGYEEVYRTSVEGNGHDDALYQIFRMFNVPDLMPGDYNARYVATGDIVFIDEGRGGHYYYRLEPDGWKEVNRIHIK